MKRLPSSLGWLPLLLALLGPAVGLGAYALDRSGEHESIIAALPLTGHDRALASGIEVFLAYEMAIGLLVITRAWNRERELRRHHELMASVLQCVTVGVVVAGTDGRFLFTNEAARRMVGGRRDRNLEVAEWSGAYGLYVPGTDRLFPADELPLARALRGEQVGETEVLVHDPQRPDAPGTWASVTAGPIRDGRGELIGGVTVFRDITEKKQAQELAQRLSSAVEQTADSVFITDRRGCIEYVNPAFEATTGYSCAETVGATPSLLKSGRQAPEFYSLLWESILGGNPFKGTVVNRKKGGELFIAEQTITPMRDSRGDLTHFVAVMRDLTDRLKLEEQGSQLRLAASMQQSLFPRTPPSVPGWDIAGAFSSALATCGDYFDFIELPDNRLVLAVADVCGHGMGPALITAATRGYLRSLVRTGVPLGDLIPALNALLLEDLDERHFVTMLLASLETRSGALEWANLGHPPGLLIDEKGEVRVALESTGKPLGLFADARHSVGRPLVLGAGETLVVVTDGAIEAESPVGQPHGSDGVVRAAAACLGRPAREIVAAVIDAVRAHVAGAAQEDDITVVVVKRTAP